MIGPWAASADAVVERPNTPKVMLDTKNSEAIEVWLSPNLYFLKLA